MWKLNLDLLCDPSSDGCRKMDAKFGSADRGFVASVTGGGVGVDYGGRGVNDGKDCGMTMENTGEDSVITETDAKSDECEKLVTGTSVFFVAVEIVA
ncbi:hypothetical protein Tco_0799344 [Tanacetum coccineum]|uniref:Uncharacterized protein n=1 Tax=Tanacetum coccineum TaxID=301880 RepID=A0ABQ4ZSX5_9ASTR